LLMEDDRFYKVSDFDETLITIKIVFIVNKLFSE